MSAFDRLTNALQYQVVHTLGFKELRPVQELTIEAVLDGNNCVVLAPTAGGKTEAAFFPLLSAMDADDWKPVSVVYLSPIRALLNNQEPRLARYADTIGRRVFKWHGDVAQGGKKRFLGAPTDILLITPESLEAMLMSQRIAKDELFRGLQAVVIDEIHAFASDDRGAHLVSVLERLQRFCGRDFQRIGLSATVGNPDEILRWMQGSSARTGTVIRPGGEARTPELRVDHVGTLQNAAFVIEKLHPREKRLVFTDSRRVAEDLARHLMGLGVMTFVIHGSLSIAERKDAERAFTEGEDCVIVATSALELGIDVGDLDRVLQIDAPGSVASFLQRMGRTGRRVDKRPNCTFLACEPEDVWRASALIELQARGFIESVTPLTKAHHIYAHQAMAIAVQLSGMATDFDHWIDGATPFRDLDKTTRREIIEHMLAEEILADQEGRLWLGPKGEKLYGHSNFRELYAVFDAPRDIKVEHNLHEIGTVEARFLMALHRDDEPGCFVLAGRTWLVQHIDFDRGKCAVRPAPDGKAPRWMGSPRPLSPAICGAMRDLLLSDEVPPAWTERARKAMTAVRQDHIFLRDPANVITSSASAIHWWNFAGGAANLLLAQLLERELGTRVAASNLRIVAKDGAGRSEVAFRQAIERLASGEGITRAMTLEVAAKAPRGRLTKFEPCLKDEWIAELIALRLFDLEGARAAVGDIVR